jgi:hypothetical protein
LGKRKWTSYTLLIFFALFIWGFALADIFTPAREFSELENRELAQAPAFSLRALMNNSYTLNIEEHTNDQFALRDMWITIKSACETALLKTENNGIVYGKEGYMFERRVSYDMERLERNTQAVLDFAGKFTGENISLALVPTSDQILTRFLPRGTHNVDQKPIIDDIYKQAEAAGVNTVDAWGALAAAATNAAYDEDIYYRTDHHWTTTGAWDVFRGYMGVDSFPASPAQTVEDFYGTYYSKAKSVFAKPDTIDWYDIPVKSVTIGGVATDGIYDTSKFNVRDKYAAFLRGNNGITVIESDCNERRVEGKTSKILMFKDSYGNSFAPFLCYAYDEITVVDLRYFTEVEALLAENDYDEILILYNLPTFAQESSVVNLRL